MTVIISGRAIATSLGADPDDILDAMMAGMTGIEPLRHPDAAHFRTALGFHFPDHFDSHPTLRASRWVTRLIREALADAGLDRGSHAAQDGRGGDRRVAVVIGSGQRELSSVETWAAGRGPAIRADELSYRRAVVEAVGPTRVYSLLGACAAGLVAVGVAADLIDDDEADVVIAVSIEPLNSAVSAMYDRVSTRIADRIRPFDAERVGTIFGEGAAAVVLEREGDRPTQFAAVIRGIGFSSDAQRSTAPKTDGLVEAMTDAYARSGVEGADIDVVFAHGTGTAANDEAEAKALIQMRCTRAFVTSIKPMVGHTLASSGLVSLVIAVSCLERGVVPATLHLDQVDPSAAEIIIARSSITGAALRYAQIDAFGFGGINAVAVLELAS